MKENQNDIAFVLDGTIYDLDAVKKLVMDNKGLQNEILELKHQVGGYKASNTNFKKQVEKLQECCNKMNTMYEEKCSELLSSLQQYKLLEKKKKAIEEESEKLKDQYAKVVHEKNEAEIKYREVLSLPWYKRIFVHL